MLKVGYGYILIIIVNKVLNNEYFVRGKETDSMYFLTWIWSNQKEYSSSN